MANDDSHSSVPADESFRDAYIVRREALARACMLSYREQDPGRIVDAARAFEEFLLGRTLTSPRPGSATAASAEAAD